MLMTLHDNRISNTVNLRLQARNNAGSKTSFNVVFIDMAKLFKFMTCAQHSPYFQGREHSLSSKVQQILRILFRDVVPVE